MHILNLKSLMVASLLFGAVSTIHCTANATTLTARKTGYDLTDEEILGLYTLETPNKKSQLQKAELIYNNDNVLVVTTDRNDSEYELSGPDKNGVIYEGEDEPNCDGDEPVCMFDSRTVITLRKGVVGGVETPQLAIEITESNAWDEYGKDDTTTIYILNWNKPLKHAIPYFVNIKVPAAEKLAESCAEALGHLEREDGADYTNSNDICPRPRSVQLRKSFDESLAAYMNYQTSGGRTKRDLKELTAAQMKRDVFNKVRAIARKYKPQKANSASQADVLDQIDKIEDFVAQGDILYTYRFVRDAVIVVVDSKKMQATTFNIKVTNKFDR